MAPLWGAVSLDADLLSVGMTTINPSPPPLTHPCKSSVDNSLLELSLFESQRICLNISPAIEYREYRVNSWHVTFRITVIFCFNSISFLSSVKSWPFVAPSFFVSIPFHFCQVSRVDPLLLTLCYVIKKSGCLQSVYYGFGNRSAKGQNRLDQETVSLNWPEEPLLRFRS